MGIDLDPYRENANIPEVKKAMGRDGPEPEGIGGQLRKFLAEALRVRVDPAEFAEFDKANAPKSEAELLEEGRRRRRDYLR